LIELDLQFQIKNLVSQRRRRSLRLARIGGEKLVWG